MAYRIPTEEQVASAIADVMSRQPHVRSQREMVMLVSTELMCDDQDFRIGAARIRRVGVRNGLFDISITYAHDSRGVSSITCPVCGGNLESVMNRTLDGGCIELRRVCDDCGYKADPGNARPSRYVFDRRLRRCQRGPTSSGRRRSS
jgi:hypothetical protein